MSEELLEYTLDIYLSNSADFRVDFIEKTSRHIFQTVSIIESPENKKVIEETLSKIKFAKDYVSTFRVDKIAYEPAPKLVSPEKTFFYSTLSVSDKKLAQRLVNTHVKQYSEVAIHNSSELHSLLNPVSTYLGWENRLFADEMPMSLLVRLKKDPVFLENWLKVFKATQIIQYNKGFDVSLETLVSELDTKLFDHAPNNTVNLLSRLKKIPELVEQVQSLTISQVREANAKFPGGNGSFDSSVLILSNMNKKKPMFDMKHKLPEVLYVLSLSTDDDVTYTTLQRISDLFVALERSKRVLFADTLAHYILAESKNKIWTNDELLPLINFLYKESQNLIWVKGSEAGVKGSEAGEIISEMMLEKMSFQEYLRFVTELRNDGVQMTVTQWLHYLKNYDDYKDLPSAWWMHLISKDSYYSRKEK